MNLRVLIALFAAAMACRAAAPSPEEIRIIADRYLTKVPAPILEKGFSMEDGLRSQAAFILSERRRERRGRSSGVSNVSCTSRTAPA